MGGAVLSTFGPGALLKRLRAGCVNGVVSVGLAEMMTSEVAERTVECDGAMSAAGNQGEAGAARDQR